MRAFLSKRNRFSEKNRSNLGVGVKLWKFVLSPMGDKLITSQKTAYRPWAVRRIFTLEPFSFQPEAYLNPT